MGAWNDFLVDMKLRKPPEPKVDPEKTSAENRLTIVEQRLSLVEEWQRAEEAVRKSGNGARA